MVAEAFALREPQAEPARIDSERNRFARSPLVIAVVSRAAPHVKIPLWEQELSAGAACMALTVAATALGFRTAWVTGWYAYDAEVLQRFGLAEHEKIAGYIHIGRVDAPDRGPDAAEYGRSGHAVLATSEVCGLAHGSRRACGAPHHEELMLEPSW